jgi:hypothetical protein
MISHFKNNKENNFRAHFWARKLFMKQETQLQFLFLEKQFLLLFS